MRTGSSVYYLLSDQLGSTSITANGDGSFISELRYTACPLCCAPEVLREGSVRYTSGTTATEYRYTGQYADSYINLLDYGSRRYDPELGRFIQPDSIVPTSTQGVQAWDRYAFVNNNPVTYNDPSGHAIPVPTILWWPSNFNIPVSYGWDVVAKTAADLLGGVLPVHFESDGNYGGAIVGDTYAQAFDKGSTAFGLPLAGVIPGEGTVISEDLAYRYMSEEEASLVEMNGGIIPNIDRAGNPKNVFTSPNLYNSVSEAEEGLGIGSLDPRGVYPSPQYRATYQRNLVTYAYAGTVESRSGIEMITRQEIRVIRVEKLIAY
jgi:RHS repeat-associated protein